MYASELCELKTDNGVYASVLCELKTDNGVYASVPCELKTDNVTFIPRKSSIFFIQPGFLKINCEYL